MNPRLRISVCCAAFAMLALSAAAQSGYFPANAFDRQRDSDQFVARWFSTQLAALREPSLLALSKNKPAESYRFLWLRTFHHPVAVRVDVHADGTAMLTVKETSGAGGYSPGRLVTSKSRALSKPETESFLQAIKAAGFWTLPGPIPPNAGMDGAEWSVEGVKDGNYHVVTRWSPTSGPVYTLGRFFLFDLARLQIPKNEFY